MKKLNKYKIFFLLSLMPYAVFLFYAGYSAIFGIKYTFMFSSKMIYGFEGFFYAVIIVPLIFNLMVFPILPICLTYQTTYLILRKNESKKMIWIITFAATVIMCSFVFGLKAYNTGVLNSVDSHMVERIETETQYKVSQMTKNAEEIIEYDSNIYPDGIGKTEYTRSTLFIDYDNKTVSFLRDNYGDYCKEFSLLENSKISNKNVQCEIKLSDPGSSLIAYYLNNSESHRTVSFQLIMKDGSVFSIDNIKDRKNDGVYLGLKYFNDTYKKLK